MMRLPVEIDILCAWSIVSQALTGGIMYPDLIYLDNFFAEQTCQTIIITTSLNRGSPGTNLPTSVQFELAVVLLSADS